MFWGAGRRFASECGGEVLQDQAPMRRLHEACGIPVVEVEPVIYTLVPADATTRF